MPLSRRVGRPPRLGRCEPERRIRQLQWPRLDAHILAAIELALVAYDLGGQRLENELGRLTVHRRRTGRIDVEARDLDRRSAASQAQFELAAAHMVEHHDFLGDAQRVVHRGHIEQGAEAQPPAPLRHCGKKHAWRGRHAERRRMMLGDMVGTKAGAIVLFDELESRLEQVGQRRAVVVDMIEDAELQSHGLLPPRYRFCCRQSYPRGRPFPSIRRSGARPFGVRPSVRQ